jgi:diguanylate cyclase (GGDEF)-like protein
MTSSEAKGRASQPGPLTQPGALGRDVSRAGRSTLVSHNIACMEPWAAWALAGYTAWVALVCFPDVPALWLFVLYAGVLGKWCHMFPSQSQLRMFIHGALLVAAAYLIQTHVSDRLGGPGGLLFCWLAIPALAYAFMLQPRWGALLVALSVLAFGVSSFVLDAGGAASISLAGFLLIFPLALALPAGMLMRKPDELVEQTRTDRSTGLLNRDGFLLRGGRMLNDCHREKRPVTVAVFGCDDLMAIRRMYGRKAGHKSLNILVGKITDIAGSRGLAARTGMAEFTVMLPGASREKALQAIARQLGNPMRIEFDSANEEIVLVPTLVIETPGAGETSIENLHTELSNDLQEIVLAARNPSMVEQPLPSTPLAPKAPVMQEYLPDDHEMPNLPPTMPVALGAN